MAVTTDYKLASGHNNVGGLVAITSITDGTNTLDEPLGVSTVSRGVRRFTLEQPKFSGTQTAALVFSRMTIGLHKYMIDNYEGLVTVRFPIDGNTFANYNATLIIPSKADLESNYYLDAQLDTQGFRNVRCELFDIEAI
jgi:hypothetical protein